MERSRLAEPRAPIIARSQTIRQLPAPSDPVAHPAARGGRPMRKSPKILLLMVASGAVALVVAILLLMVLGSRRHDNYEYYGSWPALYLGPALIGFLAPGLLAWYLHGRTRK